MRVARRFVEDESGMTLPLAMIMIVLIGVMGAGLLSFASRDLTTVVEENRGQGAFEMADAGVGIAKRQISWHCAEDPACDGYYDGLEGQGGSPADNQWSSINGGVTLNDLDDLDTTSDSTHVTIHYRVETNDYKVISEGTYGVAKRKIEARIKGVTANNVGAGLGHPIYYTKSAVSIEVDETDPLIILNDISTFSEKDILIESISSPEEFVEEYGKGIGKTLKINGSDPDALKTWNSLTFDIPAPFNTTPRRQTTLKNPGRNNERVETSDFDTPGYAAEGKICELKADDTTPGDCDPTSLSIAEGVSSYDSTTGTLGPDGTPNLPPNSPRPVVLNRFGIDVAEQKCTFMRKPFPANNACYITYPFPTPEPPPARMARTALQSDTPTNRRYWDVATEGTPDWGALFPACPVGQSCLNRLVFVDAGAADAPLQYVNNGAAQGVMVVWCGDLQQHSKFKGVIFNLWGDGSDFGASDCTEDSPDLTIDRGPATNGVFRNNGQQCQCWLYADGGDASRAGIELGPGSQIFFLPGVEWSFKEFLDDVLDDDPPTHFEVRSWRELYE
jgi:hypothetical protein